MKLTDAFIKGIKPQSKTKSYPDGHGLVLLANPQGSMGWRYRYRFGGKAKMLSFGTYPEVSLKRAREKLAAARKHMGEGKDPSIARKQENTQKKNDFKSVTLRWHRAWAVGKDEKHAAKVLRRLEQNVFPEIGSMPIHTITAPLLIKMAQKVVKRGALILPSVPTQHQGKSLDMRLLKVYAIGTQLMTLALQTPILKAHL